MPGHTALRTQAKLKILGGLFFLVSAYVGWTLFWNRQGNELQKVQLGKDTCVQCGMIVSDVRFSVSILVKNNIENLTTLHFDDVGCFLKYAHAHQLQPLTGVVHDYETSHEFNLQNALFVKSGVATPMGSGWTVIENRNSALKAFSLGAALQEESKNQTF
jgi:hypothetical protein